MNTLQQNTQHSPFTLSIDDQQIASLIVNVTDKKRNTLSAEFDLNSLMGKSDNELEAFLDKIHRLMETIRQLPFPTVAAIHGSCFGLGLELALAFQYRISSDDINTQFAMPQVRSGIVPFADAISALVSHVGLKKALSILL